MKAKLTLVACCLFLTSLAQLTSKQYISDLKNQHRWLTEYSSFLSIPNVLGDSVNMVRNANYISEMLNKLGVKTELLHSGKRGSAPVVFGELKTPGATTTIALYAHYDGQPVASMYSNRVRWQIPVE